MWQITSERHAMASWYYALEGQQSGPVEDAVILRLLREGKLTGQSYVWTDGMAEWAQLSSVRHMLEEDLSELMPQRREPDPPEGDAPGGAPLPAGGQNWQQQPGSPETPVASMQNLSPHYDGETAWQAPGEPEGPIWEEIYTPFWQRLIGTIKPCLFQPAEFFQTMRRSGDFVTPLKFLVITSLLGALVTMIWQVPIQMLNVAATGQNSGGMAPSLGAICFGLICTVPLIAIMVVITSFVMAGVYHVCLMLVGGVTQPLEATYRIVCYSVGATSVLNIIPCVGGLIASIWGLVLVIIGLHKTHETDLWRAVVAGLLPTVLCCGLMIGLVAIFFGAAMAAAVGGAGGTPGGF